MDKPLPTQMSAVATPSLSLGKWLQNCREGLGITQLDVAKRAKLSNKTVSEYENDKVKGDPSVDVVARLAFALEREPHQALAQAGLPYDALIVEQARRKVQLHQDETSSVSSPSEAYFRGSLHELREMAKRGRPIVRVSYIKDVCYSAFDKDHIRLLGNLINHDWDFEFVAANSFQDKARRLHLPPPERCHVAIGALETLERTASGLRFIPYPGLRQRLNGVIQIEGSSDIGWQDIINNKKRFIIVTINDEVGDQYVRGITKYSGDAIRSVPYYRIDLLNETYTQLLADQHPGRVVLIAAEHVCNQIIRRNQGRLGLRLIEDPTEQPTPENPSDLRLLPTYKPGLLVRYDDAEWYDLLVKAQEFAFQSATERMAELYAKLLASIHPGTDKPLKIRHELSFARLHNIELLQERDIRQAFLRSLKNHLRGQLIPDFLSEQELTSIVDYTTALCSEEPSGLRELVEEIYRIVSNLGRTPNEIHASVGKSISEKEPSSLVTPALSERSHGTKQRR